MELTTRSKSSLRYGLLVAVMILIAAGAYFLAIPRPSPPSPTTTTLTTKPPPPRVLTIAMGTQPVNLDTARCGGMINLGIMRLVSETPLDIHYATGELIPSLVERWEEVPDATKWTLYLKKGVKFHDGTPFNATAIKVTFERLIDPKTKALTQGLWQMIKSIDVIDPHTAVINTEPNAAFLKKLNYAPCGIVSPTEIQKYGDNYGLGPHLPAGTGAYRYAEYVKGSHIKLVANDQYWGGRPQIDIIYVKPVAEAAARMMALEAGEVDFVFNAPPPDIPRVKKNPDLYLLEGTPTRVMWITLNTQWGPLRNKMVRQALNYAVNKTAINERIFKGTAVIADCALPRHAFGHTKVGPYPYDPAKAKQLLRDAGYPQGFEVTLRYGIGRYLMDAELVEAIQSYLSAVGLKVRIEALEWGTFQAKTNIPLEQNDCQMTFLGAGVVQLDFDQTMTDFTKAFWYPKGGHPSFYDNPRFDELHRLGGRTTDIDKRKAYYKEAHEIFWEDAPCIFLYFEPQLYAARRRAKEVYVRHDETIWLKQAWIEAKSGQSLLTVFWNLQPILVKTEDEAQ